MRICTDSVAVRTSVRTPDGGTRAGAASRASAPVAKGLTEPPPQARRLSADRPKSFPSRPWLVTRDRTCPPMRRLPKTPAELDGLPDWPLLMTDRAAASYLSLSPVDFERGVRHLELPAARRTPGGPRWSRADLDAWYTVTGSAATDEHDALTASINAALGTQR